MLRNRYVAQRWQYGTGKSRGSTRSYRYVNLAIYECGDVIVAAFFTANMALNFRV